MSTFNSVLCCCRMMETMSVSLANCFQLITDQNFLTLLLSSLVFKGYENVFPISMGLLNQGQFVYLYMKEKK